MRGKRRQGRKKTDHRKGSKMQVTQGGGPLAESLVATLTKKRNGGWENVEQCLQCGRRREGNNKVQDPRRGIGVAMKGVE